MKRVSIQSDITIQVTSGLQSEDLTKKDSDIKDRLKVHPMWQRCLIRQGKGFYPAEIVKWPTVQALAKDGKLMIGETVDDEEVVEEKPQKAEKKGAAEKKAGVKVVQDLTLESIAD